MTLPASFARIHTHGNVVALKLALERECTIVLLFKVVYRLIFMKN